MALRPRPIAALFLIALLVPGCREEPASTRGAGAEPTATEEASPSPATADEGVEVPTETACVSGWEEPQGEQRELPFHVIRRTQKVDGEFEVDEIRYFEGPESPPSDKGYLQVVDRWYVKASLAGDPRFRGRWLIEERFFGSGVVAVAPYGSEGFESPDWIGFQHEEGVDETLRRHPGLPGRWAGRPYDFVTGVEIDSGERIFGFNGLPPEVVGCLEGT